MINRHNKHNTTYTINTTKNKLYVINKSFINITETYLREDFIRVLGCFCLLLVAE